tara:strand:+ start:326 stop:940 length:615 start_codon:yes stop_codon:yes gene_type:complete
MSNVYIISAPSGAGKTSLVKGVCGLLPFVKPAVSYTTRKIRESEENGKDYYFISKKEFEDKIKSNEFLEYQDVYGHMYGSTLESVRSITSVGSDVILEIDYKGMLAVKKVLSQAISIYISPPSIEALKDRLLSRGEDDENVINKRMASSRKEMNYAQYADYILVNDDFNEALIILKSIIMFNRMSHVNIADWAKKMININNRIV